MRSRLVTVAALVIAVAAVAFVVTRSLVSSSAAPPPARVRGSLPAGPASYLGVYENGAPPDYQLVTAFGRAAGGRPNLVGYFSGWAEPFAGVFARQIRGHDGTPLVQIDPTYASVAGIAAGDYDGYLRSYADSVRDFGHSVVIGFGHEMNAPGYSWGYGRLPAPTFIAAWRHIVTLFRAQGAYNVTWLWTINASHAGTGPIHAWWPGTAYVTWIGIDGYYYRPADTFASVFGTTITQVRAFTRKPILLSETAVGPRAGQFSKISNLFRGLIRDKLLGLVWFDKSQHDGIHHQDWRIEGTAATAARAAFSFNLASYPLVRG